MMPQSTPDGLRENIDRLHHGSVARIQVAAQEKIDMARRSLRAWTTEALESGGDQTEIIHDIVHAQVGIDALVGLIREKAAVAILKLEQLRQYQCEVPGVDSHKKS